MGHINRHLDKSDNDLIMRLLAEWKNCTGVLLKDYTCDILEFASLQTLQEGRNVLTFSLPQITGYGYDRWFEKITSTHIRAVIEKNLDELSILTAYPDLDQYGIHTGEYFDFSSMKFEDPIFEIFKYYVKNREYMTRYIPGDKPQLRLYIGEYSFSYNGKSLQIYRKGNKLDSPLAGYYVEHPTEIPQLYVQLNNPTNSIFAQLAGLLS